MSRKSKHVLAIAALTGLFAVGASATYRSLPRGDKARGGGWTDKLGRERQDRCKNGDYSAMFAGYFRGTGSAQVEDGKVRVRAMLADKTGNSGLFEADLVADGPYFSGSSVVMGQTVTIRGRIDAARMSRVSATYFIAGGHGGRFVAELPPGVDQPDDNWTGGNGSRNPSRVRPSGAPTTPAMGCGQKLNTPN